MFDHIQKKLYFYPSPWYHDRKVNIRVWLNWVFKSPHSDQNPSEINDFRGIFLILCLLRRRR